MLYLQRTTTRDFRTIIVQKIPGVLWHFVHDRKNFIQEINRLVCFFSGFMTTKALCFSSDERNGYSIAQKEFAADCYSITAERWSFKGWFVLREECRSLQKLAGFRDVLISLSTISESTAVPNHWDRSTGFNSRLNSKGKDSCFWRTGRETEI